MLTTVKTLTAEQRIERCHIDLMNHPNFVAYSGILMIGKVKVDDKTKTAYTNGRDVVYGREYIEGLTEPQLRGLILHENKHKMYRHITTWHHLWKINPDKANRACDYVINLEIVDEGKATNGFVAIKDTWLYDEKYRDMDSQQVFHLLDDEEGDGKGKGNPADEHGWEEGQGMGDGEKEELSREIDNAIRQGAILAGKVNGNLNRSFTDLMSARVDWREALREFVSSVSQGKDDSTWRKPNRRWLQHDIYMPSTISESMGSILVAVDTSGSIRDDDVNKFLSEVVGIMNNVNPEQVHLLYWDHDVAGHEVYGIGDGDKLMGSTKPKGGGGTSPSCITEYMKERNIKPECMVVLTDGYVGGDWGGTWNCPVLWVIIGGCRDVPSVGSVIYVD